MKSDLFLRDLHTIGSRTREGIVSSDTVRSLSSHGFRLVGWTEAREGFSFARRSPSFSQILVVVSGIGEAWMESGWQQLGPGAAYLTPPGVPHAYRTIPNESWHLIWIMHETASARERPLVVEETPTRTAVNPQTLSAAVRGLYSEAMGAGESEVMDDWVRLVALYARRIVRPGGSDPRLRRLWDAVAGDPGRAWEISELAARAGMSGEHLRRLCQRETGRSPMQQVTHLRMRHAAALLSRDAYPVADVAGRVGYENPFAFTTAFRRVHGVSPAAYRRQGRATLDKAAFERVALDKAAPGLTDPRPGEKI